MQWRKPLRQALDWLAGELHALYEREGGALLGDPWQARDAYVSSDTPARSRIPPGAGARARELLELEWHALSMFTSCGWFFDDIAGIEALQVLRYAARAIELSGTEAVRLEAGLLERLAQALSSTADATGRDLYLARVKPRVPVAARVAAGAIGAARLAPRADTSSGAAYDVREESPQATVTHRRTGRQHAVALRMESPDHRLSVGPRFTVALPEDSSVSLGLADLPERYRFPIAAALRADLIGRGLDADERARLAAGATGLRDLLIGALLRALAGLVPGPSDAALGTVYDLVDALESLVDHIPFDVQTEFARIRATLPPDRSAALEPLAQRLGFAGKQE